MFRDNDLPCETILIHFLLLKRGYFQNAPIYIWLGSDKGMYEENRPCYIMCINLHWHIHDKWANKSIPVQLILIIPFALESRYFYFNLVKIRKWDS